MIPLSLLLGVVAARRAGRPTDHAISHRRPGVISLPEFVIGSLLILLFFTWLDWLPPVALIPPGESPLSHPKAARAAGADAARRDAGGLDPHGARGHGRGAALGLRRDGAAQRLSASAASSGATRCATRWRPSVQVFAQNIQYLSAASSSSSTCSTTRHRQGARRRGRASATCARCSRSRCSSRRFTSCSTSWPTCSCVLLVPEAADGQLPVSRLRFARTASRAWCGVVLLVLGVLLVALSGRSSPPHSPRRPIGIPLAGPADGAPLGTDILGRDVLSRVLWGGRSVLGPGRASRRCSPTRRRAHRPRRRLRPRSSTRC